jgi:hypothetical protein
MQKTIRNNQYSTNKTDRNSKQVLYKMAKNIRFGFYSIPDGTMLIGENFTGQADQFDKDNADTIKNFNSIYGELLSKSSLQSKHAELNDDYMPLVIMEKYHQASAAVPKRLMYYFSHSALKYPKPATIPG